MSSSSSCYGGLAKGFLDSFVEVDSRRKRTLVDGSHPNASCFYAYEHEDVESDDMVSAEVVHDFIKYFAEAKQELIDTLKGLDSVKTELEKVMVDLALMKSQIMDLREKNHRSDDAEIAVNNKLVDFLSPMDSVQDGEGSTGSN